MSTLTATLKDGRTVQYLSDQIGEGGMKRVYFTTDKKSVVCFFKDQDLSKDVERMGRLEDILGKYNPTRDATVGKYFEDLFCWPTGIVVKPQFGVMTPTYSKNFFFASGTWQGKEKEGKWFSSPKLRRLLPPNERGNWADYLRLCTVMARAVRKLHMTGLAHSDLSCKNVLIDPPGGRCAVIDIDSLVVPGKHAPDVLGTPGYIAPEVLATQHLPLKDKKRKLPSSSTDLHALAVLIYEYLLRRHPLRGPKVNGKTTEEDELMSMGEKALFVEHPTDRSNRPEGITVTYEHLGSALAGVVKRAFIDGLHNPQARPTGNDWESALAKAHDVLIPCGNSSCEEKWFLYTPGVKPKCPWCQWELKEQLPVLEFYYRPGGRKGQFRPENYYVVAHDQKRLHRWHVFRNARNAEGTDMEIQAYVMKHQGKWVLVNNKLPTMISPADNPVPLGQGCELRAGDEVLLSKEEDGRLLTVKMIP